MYLYAEAKEKIQIVERLKQKREGLPSRFM